MICIRTDYIYIEYYKRNSRDPNAEIETVTIKYEFFDLSRWAKKAPKERETIKF